MHDITPQRKREQDESLRAVYTAKETIDRPKKNTLRSIGIIILLVIGVGLLLFVFSLNFSSKQPVTIQPSQQKESQKALQESDSTLFDQEAFYGLKLHDEQLYFGRRVVFEEEHYRLQDVFYDQQTSSNATISEEKIILVKFGTEEHRPKDELFLPKEQVKEIFLLDENSPILKAIEAYLER